jgi:hypothetical protein
MTPEEEAREAARVAAYQRHFLRRKPHELRMQPVNAITAFSLMPPAEVIEVMTGEPVEGDEPGVGATGQP